MDDSMTFGAYLAQKRKSQEIPLRRMADEVGMSPGYYCDVEQGRRHPPERAVLDRMIGMLNLREDERIAFYDLAGRARSSVSPDLPEYIMDNEFVRVALRIAKDKASRDDWMRFIENLEQK